MKEDKNKFRDLENEIFIRHLILIFLMVTMTVGFISYVNDGIVYTVLNTYFGDNKLQVSSKEELVLNDLVDEVDTEIEDETPEPDEGYEEILEEETIESDNEEIIQEEIVDIPIDEAEIEKVFDENIYIKVDSYVNVSDLIKIQTAIDEAPDNAIIVLGDRTYNIASPFVLKSNITIQGSGDSTIINMTADDEAIWLGTPNTTVSNLIVKDFKITTDITSDVHSYYGLINSDGATLNNIIIDNITIDNSTVHRNNIFIKATELYTIKDITVKNCNFLGAGRMNLEMIAFGTDGVIQGENIYVYDNYFTNSGFYSQAIGSSIVGWMKNVVYEGNTFDTNNNSIEVGGSTTNIYIRNNTFVGTSERIIESTGKDTKITKGLIIEGNSGDSTNNGLIWLRGVDGAIIRNNDMIIERIMVVADSSNIIVEDNEFTTTASSSVSCEETSTGCIVRNNTFNFTGSSVHAVFIAVSNNHTFYNNSVYYSDTNSTMFLDKGSNNSAYNNVWKTN